MKKISSGEVQMNEKLNANLGILQANLEEGEAISKLITKLFARIEVSNEKA
jgi:hypothetical protein